MSTVEPQPDEPEPEEDPAARAARERKEERKARKDGYKELLRAHLAGHVAAAQGPAPKEGRHIEGIGAVVVALLLQVEEAVTAPERKAAAAQARREQAEAAAAKAEATRRERVEAELAGDPALAPAAIVLELFQALVPAKNATPMPSHQFYANWLAVQNVRHVTP